MTTDDGALLHGLSRGITVFRWLTLAWAWVGLGVQHDDLAHPWAAVLALVAMTMWTVVATTLVGTEDPRRYAVAFIVAELALGAAVLVVDGLVFEPGRSQSLPWAWPATGIINAAVIGGARWALASGVWIAAASIAGESLLRDRFQWTVAAASKSALFLLAGLAASYVARRLRDAEEQIALARARAEVARTLHDGVLQTLAVIQRRSDDDALRTLARTQDRELRSFLFGRDRSHSDVATALREAVTAAEQRFGITPQLVVADDVPAVDRAVATAVAGAVTEALANAAKHSGADRIVVFAEPADDNGELFCSVRDNGSGFDQQAVPAGEGLRGSIIDRIAAVGGRVEIDSRTGGGTEVRLWVR
jgi:signal transduction histidine kinase